MTRVLMSILPSQGKDVCQLIRGIGIEMVDAIGIVPHDGEIRGGSFHGSQTAHGFIAVCDARGIGVLGHTPDALHRRVLYQLFHQIHIRAGFGQRDSHQLKAQILCDGKVTVISRHQAEELAVGALIPGLGRVQHAEHQAPHQGIIHHGEAGAAADNDILPAHSHDLSHQAAGFPGCRTAGHSCGNPCRPLLPWEWRHPQWSTWHRRAPAVLRPACPCHIEVEPPGLDLTVLLPQFFPQGCQLL